MGDELDELRKGIAACVEQAKYFDQTAEALKCRAQELENELKEKEAEQKRREAEASRSYGEREAEKSVTLYDFGDNYGPTVCLFGLGATQANHPCVHQGNRAKELKQRLAAAIDAARADMREQAAKVIDVARSLGSATVAERRTEFVDRIAVAAAIRSLK